MKIFFAFTIGWRQDSCQATDDKDELCLQARVSADFGEAFPEPVAVEMISWLKRMRLLHGLPDFMVLTAMPGRTGALYLTFDDGPDPRHTPGLLDLLREHQVRATFFLVGAKVEGHPQLVQRVLAEGHRLGNHSYSHPNFNRLSLAGKMTEIDRTDRLLEGFDGIRHHGVRPPSGAFSVVLTLRLARQRRRLMYWSYDSLDYQHRPPEELVQRMRVEPPRAGDIVLMHDDSDCCTRMLEILLPEWRAAGLRFDALPT